jgi:hypothetical protein
VDAFAHVSHLLGGTKMMVADRAQISRNVKSERSYRSRSRISRKKVEHEHDYEQEHE